MSKLGVFFDFDSTITTPIKLQRFGRHCIADQPGIFSNMSVAEIVANFGGRGRVSRLAGLFRSLVDLGCELFVVSIGFRDPCILPHMRAVGFLKNFRPENIYGRDSEELRASKGVKAQLIKDLMAARGWRPQDALFVDDSARHVECVAAQGVCEVLRVAGCGLSGSEMDAVLAACKRGFLPPRFSRIPGPLSRGHFRAVDSARRQAGSGRILVSRRRASAGPLPEKQEPFDEQSTTDAQSSEDTRSDTQSETEGKPAKPPSPRYTRSLSPRFPRACAHCRPWNLAALPAPAHGPSPPVGAAQELVANAKSARTPRRPRDPRTPPAPVNGASFGGR